ATLNVFTIVGAAALWKTLGIYSFAIGYLAGACTQLAVVYSAARSGLTSDRPPPCQIPWRLFVSKPASLRFFPVLLSLHATPALLSRTPARHARVRDTRRSRNRGGDRILPALRRRTAHVFDQPDIQFSAAGDCAVAEPVSPARSVPAHRPRSRAGGTGFGRRL